MLANNLSKEINMNNNNNKSNNEWKQELNDKQIHILTINTTSMCSGKRTLLPLSRDGSPQWKYATLELRNCQHVLSEWNHYNRVWIKSYSITLIFFLPLIMRLITYLYIKFSHENEKSNFQLEICFNQFLIYKTDRNSKYENYMFIKPTKYLKR